MKVIHKYTLHPGFGRQTILMPVGARILKVDMQGMYLRVWALVDPEKEGEAKTFNIIGTGVNINGAFMFEALNDYVDTIQDQGAVFHIFVSK